MARIAATAPAEHSFRCLLPPEHSIKQGKSKWHVLDAINLIQRHNRNELMDTPIAITDPRAPIARPLIAPPTIGILQTGASASVRHVAKAHKTMMTARKMVKMMKMMKLTKTMIEMGVFDAQLVDLVAALVVETELVVALIQEVLKMMTMRMRMRIVFEQLPQGLFAIPAK
jgi:hypothetical protein